MLVHPNPMKSLIKGHWQDTRTGSVIVKPAHNHRFAKPERWEVYLRKGGTLVLQSPHITEEMAVTIAQTHANRLVRSSAPKKRRKKTGVSKKAASATLDFNELRDLLNSSEANYLATTNNKNDARSMALAQDYAQELIDRLTEHFNL